jgi:hypothetical protein
LTKKTIFFLFLLHVSSSIHYCTALNATKEMLSSELLVVLFLVELSFGEGGKDEPNLV